MLGVNDANETSEFLSRVNASVSARVSADAWCD